MSAHDVNSKPIKTKTGIRVGNFGHRSIKDWFGGLPKKLVLVAGVVVLVLIVGGVWLFVLRPQPVKTTAQTPPKTAEQKINDTTNKITSDFLANSERSDQTLQAAQDKLTAAAQQAKTPAQKQQYTAAAVNLYVRAGKDDLALTKALAADASSKTALSGAIVGSVYEDMGDYAHAAEFYKTAADRSPKTAPTERSAYNDYTILEHQMEAKL